MKVVALKIKHENNNIQLIDEAYFKKDKGILGDSHALGGDRQISILNADTRSKIDNEIISGLCTIRFHENITVEGLELDKLFPGQQLSIGDAIIEISSMGKRCFEDCTVYKEKKGCSLSVDVIFGKVLESGMVILEDKITPLG